MNAAKNQGACGEIESLKKPPNKGPIPIEMPLVMPWMLIYRPRLSGGARFATYVVAVGTIINSPRVITTIAPQNIQKVKPTPMIKFANT